MTSTPPTQPPGWYYAQGDPVGTQRYWDGAQWQGAPQAVQAAGAAANPLDSMRLADGGVRMGARLIDAIIYGIINFILVVAIGGGNAGLGGTDNWGIGYLIAGLISAGITCGIEVYLVANGGASIGKKLLSLKVVNEDGSDVDMTGSVKRFSIPIANAILSVVPILGILSGLAYFVIGVVGLIMIFTQDRKQAVWDKIAGTVVIKN